MTDEKDSQSTILPLLLLVFSAFLIRVAAFHHTLMMNNDGPIYIHQARALYYGLWSTANTCSPVDYLTLYSILTTAAYPLFGDWVRAAMAVNLIFGALMIIPLYLLLRRFLNEETSFLTTFIFVMLPLFVVQSVNVIRDPSYWFFSFLGLYLLVRDDESKTPYALVFSSLSFLIAAATRIEAIVFILGGCFYTLTVFRQQKFKAAVLFLSPIIAAISCFFLIQFLRHPENFYWYRFREIPRAIEGALNAYHDLEHDITSVMSSLPYGNLKEFLENSRTLIWFTAVGVILNSGLEAFFYVFFALLLLGLWGIRKKMQNDGRILPLLLMTMIGLVVLYFYCLYIWSMENRRLALIIIPTAVMVGFGAENLMRWMRNKFGLSGRQSVILLCLLVLALTLPKDMRIQEEDKLVYKEIGETIARDDGGPGEIDSITLGDSKRMINYYANLHVAGAPCPDKNGGWHEIIGDSYSDFIGNLKTRKIRYIIWEENHWPRDAFNFLESVRPVDLRKIKEWRHRDTGRILLYRVLY